FHAAGRLGASVLPLNARLTPAELRPLVERGRPGLVLAEEALRDRLGSQGLEDLGEEVRRTRATAEIAAHQDPGAVVATLFTSGTTGCPKAAQLTTANFAASSRASAMNLGASPAQRWLAALPLFHVGGLAMAARCAEYGAALVLHEGFDPEQINEAIDSGEVSHASLVATGLRRVLEAREGRRFPSSLEAVLVGGGPTPVELLAQARALGAPVLQTYGLTEACSQVATEPPAEADGATAGPALPGVEVRVVDESRRLLPPGEVGEIEVRGPTVMRGYLGDDDATARTVAGGWLRTLDLGSLDPRGRLSVFARRADLIVSGGENVYPAEVEAALLAHPQVADAAVLGRPDPRWGQVPVALVVARGAPPDPGELDAWCRQRLAGFKVPRRFLRVGTLPRNAGGKLDRGALDALLAGLGPEFPIAVDCLSQEDE
ncbi:MAG: o-succinylbenzoate--CoA ligase, partial [Myxococcaceae bacterium]